MEGPQQPVVPSSAWFGPTISQGDVHRLLADLGAGSGVAVLAWPRDERHIELLDSVGVPRLFLVPDGHEPPLTGPLQDWTSTRLSADEVHCKLVRLCRVAARRREESGPPDLRFDETGWHLFAGADHVDVPSYLVELAEMLVSRFREPVTEELLEASLPCDARSRQRLSGRLGTLSGLVNVLGLEVVHAGPGDAFVLHRCWSVRAWSGAADSTIPELVDVA